MSATPKMTSGQLHIQSKFEMVPRFKNAPFPQQVVASEWACNQKKFLHQKKYCSSFLMDRQLPD